MRAATTGISAFVDPTGRMLESIPMGRDGIIYATFEPRTRPTPYVRFGDWFAWAACAAVAWFSIYPARRRGGTGDTGSV